MQALLKREIFGQSRHRPRGDSGNSLGERQGCEALVFLNSAGTIALRRQVTLPSNVRAGVFAAARIG
jgi:hypothetical protein